MSISYIKNNNFVLSHKRIKERTEKEKHWELGKLHGEGNFDQSNERQEGFHHVQIERRHSR